MYSITPDNAFAQDAARWIWSAEGAHRLTANQAGDTYRVRRFRRTFEVADLAAARLSVAVSADSRYVLFCNGQRVGRGPAKGDVFHHFFETYDLTPHLRAGRNVLAALVMDFSTVASVPPHLGAPSSIMTRSGGFVLDGVLTCGQQPSVRLSTDHRWRVQADTAYRFQNEQNLYGGFIGYFEHYCAAQEPMGWKDPDFDDSAWEEALEMGTAYRYEDRRDCDLPYGLIPRMIPMLEEERLEYFAQAFLPGGGGCEPEVAAWLAGRGELVIEAGQQRTLILDAGVLTTSFPVLSVQGGLGSQVRLTYAEALRLPNDTPGANILGAQSDRSTVSVGYCDQGSGWTFDRRGEVVGWCDIYEPSGRAETYEPFHWRTFQFIELKIATGAEPMTLRTLAHRYTAYPFEVKAAFECSDPQLGHIWDVSLRTMRLCCHETFEDCPYYEQMQYSGDAEITSHLAMMVSGDTRLTRQALFHFDWSRLPEGITQSRYPSRLLNIIPSWSLHWIGMIYDYFWMTADEATVEELRVGMHAVLDWFDRHKGEHGLPERLPYWLNADWCPQWDRGQVPGWRDQPSAIICSQYLRALDQVAQLEEALGNMAQCQALQSEADRVRLAIRQLFWSPEQGLFADCPDLASFSQYANAWAVCAGVADDVQGARMLERFPHDPCLAPASFFGMHFVMQALARLGATSRTIQLLGPWREMVEGGLSTFAEETTYWRSLCHAWSAHPALKCLGDVLGVSLVRPGWQAVRIAPQTLGMEWARGQVPTPVGPLGVCWECRKGQMVVQVQVPQGLAVELALPGGGVETLKAGETRRTYDLEDMSVPVSAK